MSEVGEVERVARQLYDEAEAIAARVDAAPHRWEDETEAERDQWRDWARDAISTGHPKWIPGRPLPGEHYPITIDGETGHFAEVDWREKIPDFSQQLADLRDEFKALHVPWYEPLRLSMWYRCAVVRASIVFLKLLRWVHPIASEPVQLTPLEWQQIVGFTIIDPDGWRHGTLDYPCPRDWDAQIPRDEFNSRAGASTCGRLS